MIADKANIGSRGGVSLQKTLSRWSSVWSMLDQRRRRWPSIKPTLGQRLVAVFLVVISGSSVEHRWCNINPHSAGTDFSRQNLTSTDVKF